VWFPREDSVPWAVSDQLKSTEWYLDLEQVFSDCCRVPNEPPMAQDPLALPGVAEPDLGLLRRRRPSWLRAAEAPRATASVPARRQPRDFLATRESHSNVARIEG